jgi:hypothetical protein
MRVYTKLTGRQLGEIADEIGVELNTAGNTQPAAGKPITRGRNAGKTLYTFVLRPDRTTADADGNARHQRESAGYGSQGRKVHAVCWHGHADFMTLVMQRDPSARIETGIATYAGRADFLANYTETAWRNIGAPIAPVAMASACRCGFADTADHAKRGLISE